MVTDAVACNTLPTSLFYLLNLDRFLISDPFSRTPVNPAKQAIYSSKKPGSGGSTVSDSDSPPCRVLKIFRNLNTKQAFS
jgi:hypothetical protein